MRKSHISRVFLPVSKATHTESEAKADLPALRQPKERTDSMRRLAGFCATLGLVAAGLMTSVPAAQASTAPPEEGPSVTAYGDCPANWFCVWTGTGGTSTMARFQAGDANLANLGMNNNISSVWNRTGALWCLYDGTNYQGDGLTVPAGWYGNLSPYGFDNKASSLRKCP